MKTLAAGARVTPSSRLRLAQRVSFGTEDRANEIRPLRVPNVCPTIAA